VVHIVVNMLYMMTVSAYGARGGKAGNAIERSSPGVGNLLVVLCQSNVAKSLSVPTHPSPP